MYFTADYKAYLEYEQQIRRFQDGNLTTIDDAIFDSGFVIGSVLRNAFDYDFFVDWCKRNEEAKQIREGLYKLEEEIKNSGGNDELNIARMKAVCQLIFILE